VRGRNATGPTRVAGGGYPGSPIPFADPGRPDTRTPARFLWWLARRQARRVAAVALWSSLWMVGLALPPYLVSRAVDTGLRPGDLPVLAAWSAAIVGISMLNAALGLLRHRTMTFVRLDASLRTAQLVARQAVRLGDTLPRLVSAGEVVNIGTADIARVAETLVVCGPGAGAVVAYAVVTMLLLRVSPLLAAIVLLGVPAVALLVAPLLGRLRRVEGRYREHQGALTARAGDIVAGLRVLSGVGGKDVFAARYRDRSRALMAEGYRVGAVTSWVFALAVGVPAVFVAVVVWLAARLAAGGDITVGEMTAVYGYVAVLAVPVGSFIESADSLARGLVSAGRVLRILNLAPLVRDADPSGHGAAGGAHGARAGRARPHDAAGGLHDPDSGLAVPAGRMLALASDDPAAAAAIVDRLGRYVESGATWGTSALGGWPVAEIRRRVVVARGDAHLFAGTLRETVTPGLARDDAAVAAALHAAAADDIVEALPGGLDARVEEKGRNLSGGQCQRLRLARALLTDAEVLLLVEPTSAVDVLTEAMIATRLHAARRGGTTVVVSTSPLLLARAESVAYVSAGRVAATGTHAELLRGQPGYRALVLRGEDGEPRRHPDAAAEAAR
jgi:ABC-type multidrug transport system fused ATPase/permease subunit